MGDKIMQSENVQKTTQEIIGLVNRLINLSYLYITIQD
jgi:hypothetical protein